VDTVFVWVRDLDSSLDWYRAFGLEPGPRHGTWQEIAVSGGTRFALHEGHRAEGPSTSVTSFRVDDLDAEIERLSKGGIEPSDPEVTDTGAARFATFTDPDGNEIQLLER
jgi:catechol 2,3-dioxygenase-like lactoylglutathione lyase family enzyme